MARQKKSPTPEMLDAGEKIIALKKIDKDLDLGNGVSVADGEAVLNGANTKLNVYVQSVMATDVCKNDFDAQNKLVAKFNSKVLSAVALKYGKDSNEYEMVGGTRESERKKRTTKTKTDKNKNEDEDEDK